MDCRIATENIVLHVKYEHKEAKQVVLIKGKKVTLSNLELMSVSQINKYTEQKMDSKLDLSFLSDEDRVFYNKNKNNPDMQWALDILRG